jgi:hypothetical protein
MTYLLILCETTHQVVLCRHLYHAESAGTDLSENIMVCTAATDAHASLKEVLEGILFTLAFVSIIYYTLI